MEVMSIVPTPSEYAYTRIDVQLGLLLLWITIARSSTVHA